MLKIEIKISFIVLFLVAMMVSRQKLTYVILAYNNHLSANPTKWLNTLKHFVGNLTTNCLSVSDHFVGVALKEISMIYLNKNDLFHIPYHKNRAIHQKILQKYNMSQPRAKNKRFAVKSNVP